MESQDLDQEEVLEYQGEVFEQLDEAFYDHEEGSTSEEESSFEGLLSRNDSILRRPELTYRRNADLRQQRRDERAKRKQHLDGVVRLFRENKLDELVHLPPTKAVVELHEDRLPGESDSDRSSDVEMRKGSLTVSEGSFQRHLPIAGLPQVSHSPFHDMRSSDGSYNLRDINETHLQDYRLRNLSIGFNHLPFNPEDGWKVFCNKAPIAAPEWGFTFEANHQIITNTAIAAALVISQTVLPFMHDAVSKLLGMGTPSNHSPAEYCRFIEHVHNTLKEHKTLLTEHARYLKTSKLTGNERLLRMLNPETSLVKLIMWEGDKLKLPLEVQYRNKAYVKKKETKVEKMMKYKAFGDEEEEASDEASNVAAHAANTTIVHTQENTDMKGDETTRATPRDSVARSSKTGSLKMVESTLEERKDSLFVMPRFDAADPMFSSMKRTSTGFRESLTPAVPLGVAATVRERRLSSGRCTLLESRCEIHGAMQYCAGSELPGIKSITFPAFAVELDGKHVTSPVTKEKAPLLSNLSFGFEEERNYARRGKPCTFPPRKLRVPLPAAPKKVPCDLRLGIESLSGGVYGSTSALVQFTGRDKPPTKANLNRTLAKERQHAISSVQFSALKQLKAFKWKSMRVCRKNLTPPSTL